MTRIFGHKWVSNYGDSDDGTWLMGLTGLAPENLAEGLRQVVKDMDDWPPSLPKFREMCLGISEEEKQSYIEDAAFEGMDSFSIAQLTHNQIYERKKRCKEKGIKNCIEYRLKEISGKNQKRLTK